MELRTFGINTKVNYDEVIYDSSVVNKIYMLSNPDNFLIKGIPDGCIDLQIVENNGNTKVYLAGSHMHSTNAHIMNYEKVFGVKFQAGTEFTSLGKKEFALNELVENRCDITDVFDMQKFLEKFQTKADFSELLDSFWTENSECEFQNRNYMVSYLVSEVEKVRGNVNITDLAEKTGYSQRYVNKVFKEKIGFSLKRYAGIIRMQYALDILKMKTGEELYNFLGYYDQAHFIHDFKRFTSITPKKYQKMGNSLFFV